MSSPAAGKALSAESLAADFGPNNALAREAIAAIERAGSADAIPTYYSVLLECIALRATGGGRAAGAPFGKVAALIGERLSKYGLPEEPADLVKNLYLQFFSRETRHGLGEYYTPDWLAERLLTATLGADLGDASKRVLDPACGSGTFLVLLIKHIRRRVSSGQIAPRQALDLILRNVAGIDVHPLAVQASRANYLMALGDLLRFARPPVEVPVYQADTVLAPPDLPQLESSFDFIVGNPPWVNWQNLAEDYRRATMPLWEHYGLFPKRQTGMQTILGAAKYDLSMLVTYVAADRYLRAEGRLGFIVSQTLFKAAAAGQGFRSFRLPDGTPLGVCLVEDLVRLKPFAPAANRTATLVLEKGRPTEYPVDYRYQTPQQQYQWRAQPVTGDPSSSWITARPETLAAIVRILGASPYRAREGSNTGGANGVFWLEVKARSRDRLTVRNVVEGARTPVAPIQTEVEPELVYPLLRGKNVGRWRAVAEHAMLITHRPGMKLRAMAEAEMSVAYPRAFSYLKRFEGLLRQRPAYKRYFKQGAPFYSLFNIGDYTFAPWKVVWREQALPFTAAVVGPAGDRVVVPDHKLMIVPVNCGNEAHYLCGALNSLVVSAAVAAYTIETQIDTHVLDHIHVPRFDAAEPVHRGLAAAARRAHLAAETADAGRLQRAERAVNRWAARLWRLTAQDLAGIHMFLREIGLPG